LGGGVGVGLGFPGAGLQKSLPAPQKPAGEQHNPEQQSDVAVHLSVEQAGVGLAGAGLQ